MIQDIIDNIGQFQYMIFSERVDIHIEKLIEIILKDIAIIEDTSTII
ncbi:MAG: hypothetical protein P1U46_00460 [Patescibacteria group bacterium]|nr:hypothetical protein [Patescibacteria group bacterium]